MDFIKTYMNLIENKAYWVILDKIVSLNITKDFYDSIKYCIFVGRSTNYTGLTQFFFIDVRRKNKFYKIEKNYCDTFPFIFIEKDDFFREIVKIKNYAESCFSDKIYQNPIIFDDFINQKIKENQEKYPEKWIF